MQYKMGVTPNTYRYNVQTSIALVPALLALAGYGGQVVMGTFMVGSMVTYILDAMQYREGSFAALWITLVAVHLGLLMSNEALSPLRLFNVGSADTAPQESFSSSILSILLLLIGGQTLLLTGCWATLQFKWIQNQYPVVSYAVEKLVVQAALPAGITMHGWGLIASVGASHAPFYLMAIACGLYRMFNLPLRSSFSMGKAQYGDKESIIQDKGVAAVNAMVVILLPAVFYLVLHLHAFTTWLHFWSTLLLVSIPTLWVCLLEEGIWWLGSSKKAQAAIRKVVALAALGAVVMGIEGRVVFHAFEQYIILHPPWSYIIITAAIYGAAAMVVLHITGVLGNLVDVSIGGVVLVLSSAGGCLALGVPITVIPAPLAAAAGISLFYESRQLRDYILFAAGSALTAGWFLYHHFWFLQISMGSYSVRDMCVVLMAMLVPALALPGLLVSGSSKTAISAFLSVHAILLCVAEEHLFAGAHGEEQMYPAYMVLLTTSLGVLVTSRMDGLGKLSMWGGWVSRCCYGAKLSMLAVPEAYMVTPTLLYALAASSPVALFGQDYTCGGTPSSRKRRTRIKPWEALLFGSLVVLVVASGRFTVFDSIQWLTASQPSEAVAAGGLLLATALGLFPLIQRHFPNHVGARNFILGLCTVAALLFLLRPPFPVRMGAKCPHLPFGLCPRLWDEAHAPFHEVDDYAIYGSGESRRSHQPLWLLIAAVCCGLMALAPGARQGLPGVSELSWKLMISGVSGSCVAGYVALEFFRHCFGLQILIWVGMLLVASSVVLLHASADASASALLSIVVWMATFPPAVTLEAYSPLPQLPRESQRLFPDSALEVETERHDLRRASLLGVFAAQAVLIAFVIKLRDPLRAGMKGRLGRASEPPMPGKVTGPAAFLGGLSIPTACMPAMPFPVAKGSRSFQVGSVATQWMHTIGNTACILAFTLTLTLSFSAAGTTDVNIFVLAPLLLLLNPDGLLLRTLTSGRRYFPPAAAIAVYLGANAANQVLEATAMGHSVTVSRAVLVASPMWYFARNAACLAACLPTHAAFLKYLWDWQPQADAQLVVLMPLNLISLCLTDLETIRLLAVLAMVATCLQHLSMRQHSRQSMRII